MVEDGSRDVAVQSVRDGICVDPPLCQATSQGKYPSCTEGLVCLGEIVGKIGERTCDCGQCQVRQGMKHDTWMTSVFTTQRCAILSLPALEPRVFRVMKCALMLVQLCTCCICVCYC